MTKKLKIIFSIIAWCVLIYYIINYNNYDTLLQTLSQSIYNGWRWGLIAILLCPLNWYLEAKKWQTITKKLQPLTTKKAILSILNGIVVAFFTPNRIGEMPARCLDLEEGNRVRGLSLGIISSISQTLVIGLWGIPALILFIQILQNHKISLLFPVLIILIILLTYCLLPSIIKFFSKKKEHSFLVSIHSTYRRIKWRRTFQNNDHCKPSLFCILLSILFIFKILWN
jgi:hypothetical protein